MNIYFTLKREKKRKKNLFFFFKFEGLRLFVEQNLVRSCVTEKERVILIVSEIYLKYRISLFSNNIV